MTVDIANRLVQLRKEHKLSQEELAEKLGLSRQAVSKWERAEASPDTDNLIMLSRLYGVSLDELLKTDASADEFSKNQNNNSTTGSTKEGERQRVHIGYRGIHVEDEKEYVHVGWDGIRVIDKNGENVNIAKGVVTVNGKNIDYKKHLLRRVPFAIIVAIAYLVLGFQWGFWHPSWLLFLTIPIFESLVTAIEKRNPAHFAFPILATLAFLYFGLFLNAWHPGWVVFLTIPIYYTIFPCACDEGVSLGAVPDDLKHEFEGSEYSDK